MSSILIVASTAVARRYLRTDLDAQGGDGDHLAGAVGVALADSMQRQGLIETADACYRLTAAGQRYLERIGLDIDGLSPAPSGRFGLNLGPPLDSM